ncbi:MAG TPA: MarP family serine protease [Actinomycetota bacterium]|nr:MarP family serine protease [Actinomycetota bacterium]
MSAVDLVLLALSAGAAYTGYRRGALLQVLAYGGLGAGLVAGALLAPYLARVAERPEAQAGIALGTFLALGLVGDGIGWLVGSGLRAATHRSRLRAVDRAAGSLISVGALLLATWFLALNLVHGPSPALAREIRRSAIVRGLAATLPEPPSLLAQVRRFLNRFGFPEVFAGLPPAPAAPVEGPTRREVRRAVAAADDATVQVAGEACGRIQEGSGFLAAPGYVVTNAHVVAGVDAPEVREADGTVHAATPVLFDPELDVAVLRIAEPVGPPLELATEPAERGEGAAVLGYPEGGGLTAVPAALRARLEAVGRDIYGRGRVRREVYELQAEVRPGNSGGPFVDADGTVLGVVFAGSTTDPGIGYALASDEVEPALERAEGRTAPVPTGPCLR